MARRLSGVLTAKSRSPAGEIASGRTCPLSKFTNAAPARCGAQRQRSTEARRANDRTGPDGMRGPPETVVITGIAGGQGRLIARRIAGARCRIIGVDRAPWEGHPADVRMYVVDIRKRKFEDVFRTERPDAVVHHAFVRHFRGDPEVRHEVNVLGTKRLLEYAIAHGVKRMVVLSSAYVYGALPDNPYYMDEEFPLNVSRTYPEVRDLAEVDTLATAFLWRHP